MDTWRPLLLFVVFAALISAESTQVLQYSPTSVVCSGPCCPECLSVGDLQKPNSCDEQECFPEYISYGAEYAIDNSLQTLWNTSAIYSNIQPLSVGLTLDLRQERHGIQRIEVHGKAYLLELRVSSDGVSFDSVDIVVYSEKSNKLEIEPALSSLGVPQARYIHLQFSDVELPEIAEVYIFASQESGGFCILQLINQLENITEQLRVAFQAFGDSQRLEMIQELLSNLQEVIDKVEINVPRLKNTLEEKALSQAMQLIFDISQIYKELQDISSLLQGLLVGSLNYSEAICDLENRITSISNELNSQLNVIMKGTEISMSVNKQSFASDKVEILMHKAAAEKSAINSYFYSTSTERINARVIIVSEALEKSAIEQLGLVATSVQEVTSDSMNKSATLDALLMELEQSKESIFSYNSLVAASRLALSRGQAQLNEVHLELMLSSIMILMSSLDDDVMEYQFAMNIYNKCNDPAVCTLGNRHAEMLFQNSSIILNVSQIPLQRGRALLNALFNLTGPFSYADIRISALQVQNISGAANSQLEGSGVGDLYTQSSLLQQTSFVLSNKSLQLLNRAKDLQLTLGLLQEKHGTLSSLLDESSFLATNYSSIRNRLSVQADQVENTDQLQRDTEYTRNLTEISNTRVSSIDIDTIGTIINDISTNTENASRALETSLINSENTELFINATRRAIDKFSANVSAFVAENTRIIEEIDTIIASLGDIHMRVNMINSPLVLESSLEQESSFLSLQPPLDRPLNDTVQFESIDLYFWTGPQFRTPTILFYLGPLCSVNACDLSDFFIILLENGGVISIQWRIGNEKGNVSQAGFQLGFSQLHIARVGASFEMRYGVSIGELGNPFTFGTIANDTILFTTSDRTAFLLGGAPNGLQLGTALKDTYASFEGQIQQILFNGEQWGLWNIRSASDTIFYGEFQRNELATVNAWHASSTSTAAAISFDGRGYLYVDQFSSLSSFSSQFRTMVITVRPNDERDGLILFAFDPEINLSMEVFFQAGDLHLLMVHHDNNLTLVDYIQELDSSIKSRRERELLIEYREGVGFRANGVRFLDSNAVFFSDLTNVKAWFGGINESALIDMMFTPSGTLAGYFGCVDITVRSDAISNIFEGDHFVSEYLSSPVQRGFSATCLQTVYASEVGFDGTHKAFLAYSFLEPVMPPNSPMGFGQNEQNILTFSFNSQRMEGIVLVLQNKEGDELFFVLQNSFIKVRIYLISSGERFTLLSKEMLNLMEWHNVLLQFRSGAHDLYLDGIIQGSYVAQSTLNIQSMSVVPEDPDQPPTVFVGGIDDSLRSSSNESLPSFAGCIRDLTYGYEAFSFLSTSQLLPRYPSGVTYHSCPILNTSTAAITPALPVSPEQPTPSLCVPSPSITNSSLGSFHRQTQLNTSNIIGLLQRSWSLEVVLLYKADGHVLSIATAEGYLLSLVIHNKMPKLLLVDSELPGPELKENESTELVVSCFTNLTIILCTLSVDDIQSEAGFIEAGSFTPEPPIILGQAILYNGSKVDSFVGCINSLSINRDTDGFDDLYTGQPCYSNNMRGIGFSGISLVEKEIALTMGEPLTIALTYKPARADGLIMLLTTMANNSSKAILAVGLRNGRVHVSSLNGLSRELEVDICDPNNSSFSTLKIKLENSSITVTGGSSTTVPVTSINEMITVSIGSVPENFAEKDQLSFLLSEEVNQAGFLPGFIGCVSEITINGVDCSNPSDLCFNKTQDILVGICPL